jgi:hypothetical protein
MSSISIRSGGQTGVDRAALDFALRTGISYGGWCPRGGWAEDFPSPPGLLSKYPCLRETPSAEPEQRSAWNVRDSHATLILVHGVDLNRSTVAFRSPGTEFTRRLAELVFLRPCHIADVWQADSLPRAHDWLARVAAGLSVSELLLNIAGPRESEAPRIYTEAVKFLIALLADDSR